MGSKWRFDVAGHNVQMKLARPSRKGLIQLLICEFEGGGNLGGTVEERKGAETDFVVELLIFYLHYYQTSLILQNN